MKIVGIITLLLTATVAGFAQNWVQLPYTGDSLNLRSIAATSSTEAVAVGDSLKVLKLTTTAGVTSWQKLSMPLSCGGANLLSVALTVPSGYIYIASQADSGSNSTILKSEAAGEPGSFSCVNFPPYNASNTNIFTQVTKLYFVTDSMGFAIGKNVAGGDTAWGQILKTTDGGSNWSFAFTADSNTAPFIDIMFVDSTDAFALRADNTIFKTTDAGNTWAWLGNLAVGPLNSIYFFNTDSALAVGNGGFAFKISLSNIGLPTQVKLGNTVTANLIQVVFTDPAHGWINAGNKIYESFNGGYKWMPGNTLGQTMNSISMLADTLGFAAGNKDSIYKYEFTCTTVYDTPIVAPVCYGQPYVHGADTIYFKLASTDSIMDTTLTVPGLYGCDTLFYVQLSSRPYDVPVITHSGDSLITPTTFTSWTWMRNDTIISGNMYFIAPLVDTGMYKVIVAAENNNCTSSDSFYVSESSLTSISPSIQNNFTLYPNPCRNIIVIEGLPTGTPVNITNELGEVVMKTKTISIKQLIDISSLATGAYFLNHVGFLKF